MSVFREKFPPNDRNAGRNHMNNANLQGKKAQSSVISKTSKMIQLPGVFFCQEG
jgi:hypothetical protein